MLFVPELNMNVTLYRPFRNYITILCPSTLESFSMGCTVVQEIRNNPHITLLLRRTIEKYYSILQNATKQHLWRDINLTPAHLAH